ncbi:hypothetical protein D1007_47484 [Hordeum vulgare]|nr:hypothetical protein D1007_47484 [Hordeum vulgare]
MARPSSGLYVSCWGGLSRVPTPPSRSPPDQALDGLAVGNELAHVMTEEMDDQPVHAPFFAWPKQAYEGEYEDDEHVGCNKESTYLYEENVESKENAEPQKNVEPKAARVPLGTLDVDNSYDPQHVRGDDEALLANNMAPTYIHDKNNPRIEVGATFPNSKAFKVALRQLAIREDWSFGTQYSDPQRFRANCTDEDCPWRIHASKLPNTKTFMVKKLSFGHTCGSSNCSKGMANRDWLADKGNAALEENPTESAKQLRETLQKEYDIKLQYTDVWKGRARAKDQLEEVFNNWIKDMKQLALVELLDNLREMIMKLFEKRRAVAQTLVGYILPSVIKELNLKSRGLHYLEARASPNIAEISGNGWRHTVNLEKNECSCRRWQICGKPCTHALRFIFSKKAKLEDYIDECFSVARFKAAYEGILMPIRGRSQWPKVNPGFDMIPPKLTKSVGRPRTRRINNCTEGGTGRKHKCKRCGALGHLRKTCKEPEIESDADRDATPPRLKQASQLLLLLRHQLRKVLNLVMTRQKAAAIAIASTPPSASTRSKIAAPSRLLNAM